MIKKIVPHRYFKKTECPGLLINYINQITAKASELGCSFEVEMSNGDNND